MNIKNKTTNNLINPILNKKHVMKKALIDLISKDQSMFLCIYKETLNKRRNEK